MRNNHSLVCAGVSPKGSRGLSAAAELLVRLIFNLQIAYHSIVCSQVRGRFCGVFTARSELCKVLFLALSLTFLYVYDISGELLNGFAPYSQGRCVWPLLGRV